MKCLVTGGSGFIGSHVVDKLMEAGYEVRIFDMRKPKYQEEVDFYKGSILDFEELRMASDDIDVVFHLAAVADVNLVVKNPFHAHRINVEGTANLLEAMRYNGVKRIVYASTVWVYGHGIYGVKEKEDDRIPPPSHFYTATKVAGEHYCMAYANHYDLEYTILRYGIPYGPRARATAVIPVFVSKVFKGEPVTIAGDGYQTRNFLYVEDLAKAHVQVLKNLEKTKNQIYNIDGHYSISIKTIPELIKSAVLHYGISSVEVKHVAGRRVDFSGQEASIKKARRELDWEPETSFEEGLSRYIQWYVENQK